MLHYLILSELSHTPSSFFNQAKPFAVLPGSGMSLEVTSKNREKVYLYMFI